jgi:hypothetical protein
MTDVNDCNFVRTLFWPTKSVAAFNTMLVKNGFTDIAEYFDLLMKVPEITPQFITWRKKDNTKAGLLKLVQ